MLASRPFQRQPKASSAGCAMVQQVMHMCTSSLDELVGILSSQTSCWRLKAWLRYPRGGR